MKKIHACKNNCILYRKEFENMNTCPTCGESRWKKNVKTSSKQVPTKVLWCILPIPRFKRIFQSPQTAENVC